MKKITDIEIVYNGTREYRDVNGKIARESVLKKRKRRVNVVSGGKRFGHYVLDLIALIIISGVYGAVQEIIFPTEVIYTNEYGISSIQGGGSTFDPSGYLVFFLFYFAFELGLGRTPGKYVTKCVVINEYGQKPTAKEILIRSISRLVPFEAFSCLGERGWHDKWSKTYLVTLDEKKELERHLGILSDDSDVLDEEL